MKNEAKGLDRVSGSILEWWQAEGLDRVGGSAWEWWNQEGFDLVIEIRSD